MRSRCTLVVGEKKKGRGYTTRSEGEGRGKWEMKVFWEL
jgi:hypothetical protein